MSFSKVNFANLGVALINAGKKALLSNSKLIASHGYVSLADAGVRLVNGQFGDFLAIETPSGNFALSIQKGSPKGASMFEVREYEALEDIVETEKIDGKWVAKEGGQLLYAKGAHYFRAIAVVEEEEE